MVALKMAVDGTLIVLKVPSVMDGARERSVADLGYSNRKVSRKVTEACDVLNIIRTIKPYLKVPYNKVHTEHGGVKAESPLL